MRYGHTEFCKKSFHLQLRGEHVSTQYLGCAHLVRIPLKDSSWLALTVPGAHDASNDFLLFKIVVQVVDLPSPHHEHH